jgi:hypothetical protein
MITTTKHKSYTDIFAASLAESKKSEMLVISMEYQQVRELAEIMECAALFQLNIWGCHFQIRN